MGNNHKLHQFWKTGDKLHVEIDMIDQKGRIWNNKDTEKNNMFEIGLPKNTAIMVDVASILEITAIHQKFTYKKGMNHSIQPKKRVYNCNLVIPIWFV